jgi:hypothetical protein
VGKYTVSGEEVIKEFATDLRSGITSGDLQQRIYEMIRHALPSGVDEIEVSQSSIEKIGLFLEVFEVAEFTDFGVWKIRDDKKFLLKAAFKPLRSVLHDEIPF